MPKSIIQLTALCGLSLAAVNSLALTRYVDLNSPSPTPPYTNWLTAATNIQDAIDAANPGDEVLVTNGVYKSGGRAVSGTLTNRVAVIKPLNVRSVHGPSVTIIQGSQVPGSVFGDNAIRCVYLTNGATLAGFTLTNGATRQVSDISGGGAWCEPSSNIVISNCLIVGNSAAYSGGGAYRGTLIRCILSNNSSEYGGGTDSSTLSNCLVTGNSARIGGGVFVSTANGSVVAGNSASESGGGSTGGLLNQCTLVANSAADFGGGARAGTLNNCLVYYNTAPYGSNHCMNCEISGVMNYCCSAPSPPSGVGNFTNAPAVVDTNGWDNLRLQSNSPCINAGNNAYASGTIDMDGRPRIVGGIVDVGAYEYQGPGLGEFINWLEQMGLPTDGSADLTDNDHDGADNSHEWRADTIPTNSLSVLRMITASNAASGLNVTWQSVSTRSYFLERATNLAGVPTFQSIATNIPGASGTKTYMDTSATNGSPCFYRVGVQE